ncbi:MAG: 2-hydroxychromene-2-carboxylate isomerase [Halioglobus sp.]|nr:2-hydroxychromene-2-carboxylate isomerase [Halioglobus sp.]MDG2326943.1 2-hydroxychromene-2-carboxylate isomerase [Halioglobus sp.]
MTKHIEFYFDFGSPTAYLAYCRLGQLTKQYGLAIQYRPMLLGGVFKGAANTSPITVPAKGKYMLEQDLPRFARRYDVPLNFNPHFPINTLNLMRGVIAAEQLDCLEAYLQAIFKAVWINSKNMGEVETVTKVLTEAGLDAQAIINSSQTPEVKAELISNTEAAVARGVFGAPTMFMDDAMYFGQDRLDFIEEALGN